MDLTTFPTLRTERLLLRKLLPSDAEALFALRGDERVMRHIARPRPGSVEDIHALLAVIEGDRQRGAGITWAMSLADAPALIGTIGYYRLKLEHHRGEVGYMLSPVHWGKGLMSEAMNAVLAQGFKGFGFHSIEGRIDPRNTASRRVLERAGFVQEALFREDCYWQGEFLDSAVFSLLAPR